MKVKQLVMAVGVSFVLAVLSSLAGDIAGAKKAVPSFLAGDIAGANLTCRAYTKRQTKKDWGIKRKGGHLFLCWPAKDGEKIPPFESAEVVGALLDRKGRVLCPVTGVIQGPALGLAAVCLTVEVCGVTLLEPRCRFVV